MYLISLLEQFRALDIRLLIAKLSPNLETVQFVGCTDASNLDFWT